MNERFERIMSEVLIIEGSYSEHEDDSGGKTKYGITSWLAKQHGYTGKMKDMDWKTAKKIYWNEYFHGHNYDQIQNFDIAFEVMEQAINLPTITVNGRKVLKTNINLQKAINLVSGRNIAVDGIVGSQTIKVVNSIDDTKLLHKTLNSYQASHYLMLYEKYEWAETFIKGWLKKRVTFYGQ